MNAQPCANRPPPEDVDCAGAANEDTPDEPSGQATGQAAGKATAHTATAAASARRQPRGKRGASALRHGEGPSAAASGPASGPDNAGSGGDDEQDDDGGTPAAQRAKAAPNKKKKAKAAKHDTKVSTLRNVTNVNDDEEAAQRYGLRASGTNGPVLQAHPFSPCLSALPQQAQTDQGQAGTGRHRRQVKTEQPQVRPFFSPAAASLPHLQDAPGCSS